MHPVVISGTGLYQPPHTITNAELVASYNLYADRENTRHAEAIARGEREALAPSSEAFIERASGIKQRYVLEKAGVLDPDRMRPHFAPRGDDALSLMAEVGVAAAQQALAAAGREAAEVDGVLCAASNMQRAYPAIAVEIQAALGAGGYAFDMNVACSSATFGIQQAVNAVQTGSARRVLVVSPEITSAHLAWMDRDCHFIFGDVATAVLVERAAEARAADRWQVLGTRLATQFSNNIRNNAGFMNRAEDTDLWGRDTLFRQVGQKVFREVVPLAAAHIEGHLASLELSPQGVRRYWLHQANLHMNQRILNKLIGYADDADRAPLILDRYANTASAGSIIAFHDHRAGLAAGDVGLICSFGAGYSVGSVVVRKI